MLPYLCKVSAGTYPMGLLPLLVAVVMLVAMLVLVFLVTMSVSMSMMVSMIMSMAVAVAVAMSMSMSMSMALALPLALAMAMALALALPITRCRSVAVSWLGGASRWVGTWVAPRLARLPWVPPRLVRVPRVLTSSWTHMREEKLVLFYPLKSTFIFIFYFLSLFCFCFFGLFTCLTLIVAIHDEKSDHTLRIKEKQGC